MKRTKILLLISVVTLGTVVLGAYFFDQKTPVSPVMPAHLLINIDTFPAEWGHNRDAPLNLFDDPLINHVFRSWGQINGGSGSAYQNIERSKNALRAYVNYLETVKSQIYFRKDPDKYLIEFHTPEEIKFKSAVADNSILLCGWYERAYCEFIAQYENYVVFLDAGLQVDYEGEHSDGLTYAELGKILHAIDEKFVELLNSDTTTTHQ
jgi:hypothetical protein